MENKKILLVEDDALMKQLYRDLLAKEGYSVDTATDGEEGFNKMKKGGWDLVLLDFVLPKLDGLQIMKKLQTDPPENKNKSIVFLTNLEHSKDINDAAKFVNGVIIKSDLNPEEFLSKIKSYL